MISSMASNRKFDVTMDKYISKGGIADDIATLIMDESQSYIPTAKKIKRRNAAEKFNEAYAKEKPTRLRAIDRVKNHNKAYPVLIDELDKRRSVGNVRVASSRNYLRKPCRMRFDPKCRACRRMIQYHSMVQQEGDKVSGPFRSRTDGYQSYSESERSISTSPSVSMASSAYSVHRESKIKISSKTDVKKPSQHNLKHSEIVIHSNSRESLRKSNSGVRSSENEEPEARSKEPGDSVTSYESFGSMRDEPMI